MSYPLEDYHCHGPLCVPAGELEPGNQFRFMSDIWEVVEDSKDYDKVVVKCVAWLAKDKEWLPACYQEPEKFNGYTTVERGTLTDGIWVKNA